MLKHGKSKKVFEHNVKTEIEAGKPQDQALAIAYEIKRKNAKKHAHGGSVMPDEEEMHEEKSLAQMIREHMEMKKMAEGGMVDIEENQEEQPMEYDELNEAALKEHYGDNLDDIEQPMDSNEHGNEEEKSIAEKIRQKAAMKRIK